MSAVAAPSGGGQGPVVVLHGPGDVAGGAGWRAAFETEGLAAVVPTLPGHAGEPPPVGGTHDLAEPAYRAAVTLTEDQAGSATAVMGVGASGWSATVMAVAGVGSALVLVDGLGDPWRPLGDRLARRRSRLREVADAVTGVAPMPAAPGPGRDPGVAGPGLDPAVVAPGLDPGVAWWPEPIGDRELVAEMVAALTVPALIVHSPASERPDPALVGAFGAGATVVDVAEASPGVVAPLVASWLVGT